LNTLASHIFLLIEKAKLEQKRNNNMKNVNDLKRFIRYNNPVTVEQ